MTVGAITNGREWRFFTDLVNPNIMDETPFLTIDFESPDGDIAGKLLPFHYDKLQPDALRTLAQENTYLSLFQAAVTKSLKDCPDVFVKYIADQADIQRNFTSKFVSEIQPIIRRAITLSIANMVTTSLSTSEKIENAPVIEVVSDEQASITDPLNNKIVTTVEEQKLFDICKDILPGADITYRDSESYFTVVYQGKSNRWLLRFWGDRRRPSVQFIEPITEIHQQEAIRAGLEVGSSHQILLDKPENLYRLAGMLKDALEYCKNDENFRRTGRSETID